MNARQSSSWFALACVAALGLGASSAAQAHGDNIYWSIGLSSPGVQVGVANGPVLVQPPIYVMRPVQPVVYVPAIPVYEARGERHRHHHGHHHGYGRGWGDERGGREGRERHHRDWD